MIQPVPQQPKQPQSIAFSGFSRGLNTAVPAGMITNDELSECVDWKYNYRGQLETRNPITRVTAVGCIQENLLGAKSRTFSTWDFVTATVAKNQIGVDGVLNQASTITDSSAASLETIREDITIIDDSLSHAFYFAVEVDTDTTRYPLVKLTYKNGTTELSESFIFSTVDGSSTEQDADGDYSLTVINGWIVGKVWMANNGTGNTEARMFIYPAASTNGTTTDVAAIGSIVLDWCIFVNGDSADADVKTIGSAVIDGTSRTLVCDENDVIYYKLGNTLTAIDTAEGEAQFLGYNNKCLVLDGSYIKYLDGVSELKMAYDTSENLFDEYSTSVSANISVSTSGVGCTLTTPNWDAGYTIPPTKVTAKVIGSTAGTGTISASFWDVSGSAEVASTTYALDLPTTLDYIDINFASTDITSELEPDTQYYCLLKGSNVDLAYETVSTAGTMITGGSTPDTTKNPIMRINPGPPPKGAYGCLSDKRPWIYGDTDNPGQAHYGKLSIFEWGDLNSVDDDATSYEIGGMKDLYGDLRVYGNEDQPYLAVLVGDVEADWKIQRTFQEIWTLPKTLVDVGNDLWCSNRNNSYPLRGVQEYGDVRFAGIADNILDRFDDNWVDTAFAAYYSKDSQYWLYMPGYSKILICHTDKEYNPWTEFSPPITPTYFKQVSEIFYLGSTDGNLYKVDTGAYKDLDTTQILPSFKTAYVDFPFNEVNLEMIQFVVKSVLGGSFDLDIYINGNETESLHTYDRLLSLSDSVTVDDLVMDVDDMDFAISLQANKPIEKLNANCWSMQAGISNVSLNGAPVFFNGFFLKYTQLEE